jgi:enterochelin esterase-like enzyme
MPSLPGLTSGLFAWLIFGAAATAIGATVWLWPRLARQGIAQITARLGLIIVSQLLVSAAVLTAINDSLIFFSSWYALAGNGSSPRHAIVPPATAGITAFSHPIVITGSSIGPMFQGGSVLPEAYLGGISSQPEIAEAAHLSSAAQHARLPGGAIQAAASSGAVLRVAVHGQYSGIVAPNDYVYLPPQYFQPAYASARFPVVLAFAGYPNEPIIVMKQLHLTAIAARLQASGRIRPAIYVIVNPSVALPRDTECTNIPAGLQVATFFGRDIPLAIQRTFRTITGQPAWGTIGYSTGATCAVKIAMLYPAQFAAAVGMSGYYVAIRDRTTGQLYGGSTAYQNENNLLWRLRHLPAPPISVLVTSSTFGERTMPGTLALLRLIRPPMRGYSLIVSQGGHNYYTWRRELPQSLQWLSRQLTKPPASHVGQQSLSPAPRAHPTGTRRLHHA